MENIRDVKILRFEWKIVVRGKTFAVAFLWTYTLLIDKAMHDSQKNIRV